ncbi:MAG: glucosidase [Actinobacteria bacterium]|nr:glucosidase [Actinomycetota bacterium]
MERDRLDPDDPARSAPWREWGPYVAARQWGTVREDYREDGDVWASFTYDDARSRAYRWGEDGLAAICDRRQHLCLGLTVWNGNDPHLKERLFGLTGPQGNHGEDVKEYWWYLDATPTSSYLKWRYHYPQAAFPYADLLAENKRRGPTDPEYELADTGIFDDGRFWAITVEYAKAAPDDICMRITARNHGPEAATIHALPTLWCRNDWTWDGTPAPVLRAAGDDRIVAEGAGLPAMTLTVGPGPTGRRPRLLFCDNETNTARLYGNDPLTPCPKDGINDHIIDGTPTVNLSLTGTKAAAWYELAVGAGEQAVVDVRLAPTGMHRGAIDDVVRSRLIEADEFYAELTPGDASADEARVLRQAFASLLWSKQFYRFDVSKWLDGDPAMPAPPEARRQGRNAQWRHVAVGDVLLMPDSWEYPWFAAWDLSFHCVTLAHVDAELAKEQLLVLLREWYMHPNGQLPAYEWSFGDVNPPVHAWAALRVFEIDGRRDLDFLQRVFHKLLINFTWWVNRKDAEGNNIFEGGFLGLDNIGPINRSESLPGGARLEQSDATGWMAMYCLNLLEMSIVLARHQPAYEDLATKFLEHFTLVAASMNDLGLWDDADGFFYDIVRLPSGEVVPIRCRSMVGLIPLFAMAVLHAPTEPLLPDFIERARWFIEHRPRLAESIGVFSRSATGADGLLSVVSPDRLRRILAPVLDEAEFLSPHGLRSLSAVHAHRPAVLAVEGFEATVDYEPGESTTGLYGGNSNWRGPIWFPLNFLIIEALRRYHVYLGDSYLVEFPTGSGDMHTLASVADGLADRLIALFLDDDDGRRPVFGSCELFQTDPRWHDLIPFSEYFHGDTGAGLGASHQTGWTALVADLLTARRWVFHETD